MFTLDYDFQPGNTVFVVIDDTRIEVAVVLSVKFDIYKNNLDQNVTDIVYKVVVTTGITPEPTLGDPAPSPTAVLEELGTFEVDSSNAFNTLEEASDSVQAFLTPTPTITPTITPTPTT